MRTVKKKILLYEIELKLQQTIGGHKMIKARAFDITYKNENGLKVDSIM